MKQQVRRGSRVADSSSSPPGKRRGVDKAGAAAPEGHVPVHVGEGPDGEAAERFFVRAELLGRPALAELLGRAAQEYGYGHRGPLRIPCTPAAFRRALASLDGSGDDDDDG
ncbi:hypothetical protein BAE44_0003560 [Dichanthelium oligosanthes]|uniref:Auxin-responsive protein SAUR71 n=1 Tax=Dichanthelium oligosanthes TaxID=888268 RepID=A0A1E5WDG9_9POAL|nr:hypothetical protein BAE44_0003560 [Dichanthelium oligosanthes]